MKSKRVEKKETDATCTEGGSITYTAIFRKKKLKTSITVETPALGHDWGEWTPDAEQGVETRACARCGEIETRPLVTPTPEVTPTPGLAPHAHTPAEAVKENETPATCAEGGSYESVVCCAECGEEISREKVSTDPLGHTGGTATCTEAAICTRCGEPYGEPLGHTPAEAVVENEVAATCVEGGVYDSVVYCSVCQAEISRETVETEKDPNNHAKVITVGVVEASCMENGYTGDEVCEACDTIIHKGEEIPSLGHIFVDGECTRCHEPETAGEPES